MARSGVIETLANRRSQLRLVEFLTGNVSWDDSD